VYHILMSTLLTFAPVVDTAWNVVKNEQDPFDKSKTTFIAQVSDGSSMLVARCLDGEPSFLIALRSNKIVGEGTPTISFKPDNGEVLESDGSVLSNADGIMAIQFGDDKALRETVGAKTIAVRVSIDNVQTTFMFNTLGRNDGAKAAMKACNIT